MVASSSSSSRFQHCVEISDSLAEQARQCCEAVKHLYEHHLWHGFQLTRAGRKQYINGDITKLRPAHCLTDVKQKLLHNLGFVSRSLSESQHLPLEMGHCWTGANIVHGPGVFVTISPSERHSGLTLRLLRKRLNDPWLRYGDLKFKDLMRALAAAEFPSLETVAQEWAKENNCDHVSFPYRTTHYVDRQ